MEAARAHAPAVLALSLAVHVSLCVAGAVAPPAEPSLSVKYDAGQARADVFDGPLPVLRYSHGCTEVPEGVDPAFRRGDYVSAIYGLEGELLTEDFPPDHLHHRAVNWAWATVQWRGETRDMFAVRNPYTGPVSGGLWARPLRVLRAETAPARAETAPASAVIEAESEWRWDDRESIVNERVLVRVSSRTPEGRFIDFRIVLTPLVDGLQFCGRLGAGYSGFNVRMAAGEGQSIRLHTDEPGRAPCRSWADYSAEFPGGSGRAGMAVLQRATNPEYPSPWLEYPSLNFFQPAYPGGELTPMPVGEPIVLEYRLWIHDGAPAEEALAAQWDAYNRAPVREGVQGGL
ncbi:MAG: PmoA family protein [Candidatus Hydrogenedentes bacterium]|nr:PmoA family protein [Candidatus Hydrogenedentota bacterium]